MNTGILKKTDSDLTEVHVKAFDVLSSPSRKSTGSSAEEEGSKKKRVRFSRDPTIYKVDNYKDYNTNTKHQPCQCIVF